MPPLAISAQGTVIARNALGAAAWLDIGELRNITPPPLSRNLIETTNQNEDWDAFVVGIKRRGEMTFQIGWVPNLASHGITAGLMESYDNGDLDVWRITFPDTSTWIFSGYVNNVGPSAPLDDGLVADVSIRPTGGMEFTDAP